MVDAHAVDFFFAWDLAEFPPARDREPGWKVGNRSDDFHGVAGTECEVFHALVDENSLEGIDLVWIKSCEGQDSQAQSIRTRFAPT
jgi:hypothetical protein